MLVKTAILWAFIAYTVSAYPNADAEPILDNRDTSKQLCTTLELLTEEQYRIGYTGFCDTYIPAEADKLLLHYASDPIVATFMLKTHTGTTIPWIFKISPVLWMVGEWDLHREMCLAGFKDYLEGEKAKLGTNYCVVDGTGGNGASNGYAGQGNVLVMGGSMTFKVKGDLNYAFVYETRRRKGEFNSDKQDGKVEVSMLTRAS